MNATALTVQTEFLQVQGEVFAYRRLGVGKTLILFNHLAANLDNWDPRLIDLLSTHNQILIFDNLGVGKSSGNVPKTIEQMADDAAKFIDALDVGSVDLVGLSMGGMVAQEFALRHPELVNKLVLVGTGQRGGHGLNQVTWVTLKHILAAAFTKSDVKEHIFFKRNATGKAAAKSYISRLATRTQDRDADISVRAFLLQLKAIARFGRKAPTRLEGLTIPVLVLNGDQDNMVPTALSHELAKAIPNAKIEIISDAGHGSLFQYPEHFISSAVEFLDA